MGHEAEMGPRANGADDGLGCNRASPAGQEGGCCPSAQCWDRCRRELGAMVRAQRKATIVTKGLEQL